MSDKERKIWIDKFIKIFLATISLIILIISIWILVDCFKVPADIESLVMNYNSNANVDYKVYLKPNKFYDQTYLGKDKKYVSNIIDYIDIDLNYMFNTTRKVDTRYTYSISASIGSEYELNGKSAELWSKKYVLVPSKSLNENNVFGFKINENLKIAYDKYDSLAKNFKLEYGIVADTKLTITINISSVSSIKDYKKNVNDKKIITLVIPLNKAVTDVTVKGADSVSNNITQIIKGENNVNYVLLVLSIIMLIVSAPTCIISFYKLFKITNVSQYMLQLRRIIKGYGDIIAEVTTKPDLNGLNVIEVKEFEDLINIEEELRIPILFYEVEKENKAWFVITTSNLAYRYILRANK